MADADSDIDFDRVMAEIDEDVRLRRASGEFPIELDRELDGIFSSVTPSARSSADFPVLLERAEEASFIDADVPTASRLPGGELAKKVLARLFSWFGRYLAQQTSVFATAAVRALRLLGERVDGLGEQVRALEEELVTRRTGRVGELRNAAARPGDDAWAELVADRLAGGRGRVLHAESGDGALVARLVELGIDAYGVEPAEQLVSVALQARVDVRLDEAVDHLRSVPDAALRGLVLSGCVDRLPAAELLALADLAARTLAPGGLLAVLSSAPHAWGRARSPVEADLAPGRPFHPETWQAVLAGRAFTDVVTHPGPTPAGLDAVPDDNGEAAVLNRNFDRLNQELFGPTSYAVTALRAGEP
jgi:SAM-dependent methyltransferase